MVHKLHQYIACPLNLTTTKKCFPTDSKQPQCSATHCSPWTVCKVYMKVLAHSSHLQPGLNDLCEGKDITMETTATHYGAACTEKWDIKLLSAVKHRYGSTSSSMYAYCKNSEQCKWSLQNCIKFAM